MTRRLEELEARIHTMLPPMYQQTYKDVSSVSMGSASMKYGSDGLVRWRDMWGSFCDLAMAGGPPHRGTLLEPGTLADIEAMPDQNTAVMKEIGRGIGLVTGMYVEPSPVSGWIVTHCSSSAMASWLARAVTMENVWAHSEGNTLCLPASPAYRIEKEIKNVITSVAKTAHYWFEHIPAQQQVAIGDLLDRMEDEALLLQPDPRVSSNSETMKAHGAALSAGLLQRLGIRSTPRRCGRWLGLGVEDVAVAITMMRLLVVGNVLARREGAVVFVPLNASTDPSGEATVARIVTAYASATAVDGASQRST